MQPAADLTHGMNTADSNGGGGQRVNPPRQAAPEDEDISVGKKPEEDAERNNPRARLFRPYPRGKPGHCPPKQRVVSDVQHGEEQWVNSVVRADLGNVLPEREEHKGTRKPGIEMPGYKGAKPLRGWGSSVPERLFLLH